MWSLVQSRGDASTWKIPSIGTHTKRTFLSLLPWWLDSRAKWYERTPTWTYSRSWKDLESCGALLEWLGLANLEWLVSSMGPHAHPSHQWCTPDIEPGSYQKCISPNSHTTCVTIGFGGPIEYGGGALPKFGWRLECHPNTPPWMSCWRVIICYPST